MPLVKNEQDVKRNSQFLDYETGDSGNLLILKSHLYQISSHFIKSENRSVACKEEECAYCEANYPKKTEYNYLVFLNGDTGYLDIRASVFFAMQKITKAQKKDMRQMSWTVIKKGEGLATKYITSKDDNLAPEDYEKVQQELHDNTGRLVQAMERHEEDLNDNYYKYIGSIKYQGTPKIKAGNSKTEPDTAVSEEAAQPEQDVNPEDVPF